MEQVATVPSLDELVAHVRGVLCEHDQLDPAQTPLTQYLVTRSGKPCGLFFHLQGPRSVKTYAVWAGEEQRVLFYDSQGVRFAETRLAEGPDTRQLSAPSTRHPARPSAA
jgi:hypothetical protein